MKPHIDFDYLPTHSKVGIEKSGTISPRKNLMTARNQTKTLIVFLSVLEALLLLGICGCKESHVAAVSASTSEYFDPSAGETYTNVFTLSEFGELPSFKAKVVAGFVIKPGKDQANQTNRTLIVYLEREDGLKLCVGSYLGRKATEEELSNANLLKDGQSYTFPAALMQSRDHR